MKNSNDTIGNRTHDLPACSAVLQLTAPPRAPMTIIRFIDMFLILIYLLTAIGVTNGGSSMFRYILTVRRKVVRQKNRWKHQ
jgi:hypothetical protein